MSSGEEQGGGGGVNGTEAQRWEAVRGLPLQGLGSSIMARDGSGD